MGIRPCPRPKKTKESVSRELLRWKVEAGLSSRSALVKGVDEKIEDIIKGRDIYMEGKVFEFGISPVIKEMAMFL